MELAFDVVLALMAVAFVAGAIDAVAGGGGLLTIPALLAFGVPPVSAIATNKLQSTFGTGGALLAFMRGGHVDLRRFAVPASAAFLGSALGAWVLRSIDPSFLAAFIPLLLIAIAFYFLLAPRMGEEDRHSRVGPAALAAVVGAIGFYDGFFGPGTGSFLTTILIALAGFGMVKAIAHAKLLNFASNLAALAVLAAGGHMLWITGLAMALANVAGNQLGAHGAMRFGARVARPLLVLMCLALTIKLLADPANPVWTLL